MTALTLDVQPLLAKQLDGLILGAESQTETAASPNEIRALHFLAESARMRALPAPLTKAIHLAITGATDESTKVALESRVLLAIITGDAGLITAELSNPRAMSVARAVFRATEQTTGMNLVASLDSSNDAHVGAEFLRRARSSAARSDASIFVPTALVTAIIAALAMIVAATGQGLIAAAVGGVFAGLAAAFMRRDV